MDRLEKATLFRERFFGRQDVYGRRTQHGYAPVCGKFWDKACHIRLKDGITCAECTIKEYTPVSNESVLQHIEGEEAQIQYVLLENGTIRFGAIDFDSKPGKEHLGYKWEDVLCVHDLLDQWGVPHGIARSTTNGFHIYFFFEEDYPANRFRSFILDVYEKVGFLEQSRMGVRPIPEIFPKQSSGGPGGIGNGIKCPMIEPQFKVGRNCWVTDSNDVIPEEYQWKHLSSIAKLPTKFFESVLDDQEVKIHEDNATSKNYSSVGGFSTREKWQPPMIGSIEKVLEGCAAFRRVRGKIDKKEEITHHEGFSLYHMCMNTADGLKWWEENSKKSNWGVSPKDQQQLKHSLGKNYAPWTCSKLQENGICVVGTKCFDKKPPLDNVEGKVVVREGVPESEWPEPSPIRYAFGTGEDYLAKLQEEVTELTQERNMEEVFAKLRDIVKRAQVFNEDQQQAIKAYIINSKVIKTRELTKLFKEAGKSRHDELKKAAAQRDDVAIEGGIFYKKMLPFGYSVLRKGNDGETESQILCDNFDIVIQEDRSILIEDDENQRLYKGLVKCAEFERSFEIETDRWDDNTEMSKFFSRVLGTRFNILKQNVGNLKHAIVAFSKKNKPEDTTYHTVQGWFKRSYVMPTVLVDKDGVRENTEYLLDLSGREMASQLDFVVLPEDKLKEVLFHIKSDLLQAWDHKVVYYVMAHVFLPPILKVLKIEYKPTLWIEGKTGAGKTALNDLVSYFYGDMKNNPSWATTWRSLEGYAHDYKDCLMVIDDYKDLNQSQVLGAKMLLQYAYDNNARGALTRTGDQRKARTVRGLILTSGEDYPTREASIISRMIIVEAIEKDQSLTIDKYDRCKEMRPWYRGVTPHFIHWILNQDLGKMNIKLNEIKSNIQNAITGRTNADRIAQNLAYNFLAWSNFIGFLQDREIVDPVEAKSMIDEHWKDILDMRLVMANRCQDEQSGYGFVAVLQELLESGKASIKNLMGYDRDHSTIIGWVEDSNPNIGYFYTNTTMELVLSQTKSEPIKGSARAIGGQLHKMGLMIDKDGDRYQKSIKKGGSKQRVWVLDLIKLGLADDNVTSIKKEVRKVVNAKTDDENLF